MRNSQPCWPLATAPILPIFITARRRARFARNAKGNAAAQPDKSESFKEDCFPYWASLRETLIQGKCWKHHDSDQFLKSRVFGKFAPNPQKDSRETATARETPGLVAGSRARSATQKGLLQRAAFWLRDRLERMAFPLELQSNEEIRAFGEPKAHGKEFETSSQTCQLFQTHQLLFVRDFPHQNRMSSPHPSPSQTNSTLPTLSRKRKMAISYLPLAKLDLVGKRKPRQTWGFAL